MILRSPLVQSHHMPFQSFLLLLPFGLVTCFYTPPPQRESPNLQVRVVIDSTANFYLDTVSVSAEYYHRSLEYPKYDSTLGRYAFVFDGLEKGETKIQIASFLDRALYKEIDLKKDTAIFIKTNELNNFHDAKEMKIPSFDLNDGDTIVIGLESLGCFHFYKENVIVSKSNGKYKVAFNNTRPRGYGLGNMNIKKEFNLEFADTLKMFSAECKKLIKHRSFCVSTTTAHIYIRKGDSVYKLPDIGCGDWQGYNRLVAALDPPWPKIDG